MKEIPLTQGGVALVDDADHEWLSRYKWGRTGKYAAAWINGRTTYMHRLIMQPPASLDVDHHDGNRLNNQRSNLRICTRSQNFANRRPVGGASQYKGVSWSKKQHAWVASIKVGGKNLFLGHFDNETDAAHAYDVAARRIYGEFARPNFPDESQQGAHQ